MRIVRVMHEGAPHWGELVDDQVLLFSRAPYQGGTPTGVRVPKGRLVAPVTPSKIVCVGRNYAAHAKELGNDVPTEPLLFLKPPSALVGPDEAIVLPPQSQRVEHEGELCVVIGRRLARVSESEALEGVFGVTASNDVTARDIQRKDVQFTRGKGFDSFCPVGPWIDTDTSALTEREVSTRVDGATRQHGSTSAMIFPVATLLSFISHVMTLEPGDIVLTGTPEGVGPLAAGQSVEVEVSGVGVLRNPVVAR